MTQKEAEMAWLAPLNELLIQAIVIVMEDSPKLAVRMLPELRKHEAVLKGIKDAQT